jgi:hypothetical protein
MMLGLRFEMQSRFALALSVGSCFGCAASPPVATDSPARGRAVESVDWQRCYTGFSPSGNPKSDLERITRRCGALGGMRAITAIRLGEQSERAPADRYTFFVPEAGACFRIFATADRNVRDLDLMLRTPDGEPIAGDLTHDSWPVVPPEGPACFEQPGVYVLEVSVFSGAGRYALQVYETDGFPSR